MKARPRKTPPWYALDHAAVIYPPTMNDRAPAFFRLQLTLAESVNLVALKAALEKLARRFPLFHVELRRGAFWYYFERNDAPTQPMADSLYPMQKPEAGKKGAHLYRVRAYHNRLALEVSHVICDGYGGITLFKTLIAEYFRLCGLDVPCEEGVFDLDAAPSPEEWEDSFARYSRPGLPPPPPQDPSWHIPGALLPRGTIRITTGRLSVAQLLAKAKGYGVTATVYLAAHYLAVLQEYQEDEAVASGLSGDAWRRKAKPLRLEVPADMRKVFPSSTLRNFSLFLEPTLRPRLQRYAFSDILKVVEAQMALGLQRGELARIISRNVEAARSPFVRAMPLPIKDAFMRALNDIYGDRMFSGVLSNLGSFKLPAILRDRALAVDLIINTSPTIKQTVAAISYGDIFSISIGSLCESSEFERRFLTSLVKDGLRVKVESNIPPTGKGGG